MRRRAASAEISFGSPQRIRSRVDDAEDRVAAAALGHSPVPVRARLREAGQKKILEQRRAAKTSKRQKHCAHQRLLGKRSKGTVAQFFYSTRQQFQLSGKPLSILRLSDRHDSIVESAERPSAQGLRRQSQCYSAAADDEQGDAHRDDIRNA